MCWASLSGIFSHSLFTFFPAFHGASALGGNLAAFMPHGHCYLWEPKLIWLHVGSDSLIGISYFSIPVALLIFASRRKDARFHKLFLLFGVFIYLCGLTHFLGVYNVWRSDYWVAGFVKLATGLVSFLTAVLLFKSLPAALKIPLPEEYRKISDKLVEESRIKEDIKKRLEARVMEQTKDLWASDSRWRLLSEFVYSAVWLCDEQGRITQILPSWERFTGQTFSEYKGDGWLKAYLDRDREKMMNRWQESVQKGTIMEFEAYLWSAEAGNHVPVLSKGIPIKDSEGNVLEWMGVVYDLSQVRRQEIKLANVSRRLEAKNKYLREFTHVASHDLREPLRKIQVYGDILKEDFSVNLPEDGRECISVMQNAAERMTLLIDELLTYSKASSSPLFIESVELDALLNKVEEDLEVAIKEAGAKIVRGQMIHIKVDVIQFQQVLQNLIDNAIKYRSKKRNAQIEISSKVVGKTALSSSFPSLVSDHYYEIVLKDNGIGFDIRHAEKIQQPFQRLHHRDEYAGTGIGLAICQKVIERHSGYLAVDSKPDVGSTFTVYLPVVI